MRRRFNSSSRVISRQIALAGFAMLMFLVRAHAQAPAITSSNNTTFTVGTSGSFTVTDTGSPTPTLSESGTIPSGVSFNASTGVLSGTPASGTAGTYPIAFTAHNGVGAHTNSLIQETDQYYSNGTGASSESRPFTSNVTSGDLLFCSVGWEVAGGSSISSVSDSLGNTYSSLPLMTNSPHQSQGFYTFSTSSGANTFTVNFTGSGGTYVGIACGEWSGPTHLDVHGEATGSSATPTSASITPSTSGELLIGYADDSSNTWSATGSWTLLSTSVNRRYGLEDQLSSGTSSVATGFSFYSSVWTAGIAAFNYSSDATQNFTLTVQNPPSPPTISGLSSPSGAIGLHVVITGTGFLTATSVTLGSSSMSFTINSSTQITAIVPSGASSGNIAVTNPGGTSNLASFSIVSPPTISASATPAANGSGWNNSPVTVRFTCTAGGLTIASCPSPQTVSSNGASQVISGTVTDSAGDTATGSVTVNLDSTPPSLTVSSPADQTVESSSPVTVTGTLTDSLSGVSGVTCDGVATTLSSGSFSCNVSLNVGNNLVVVQGTNVAGDVAGFNFHLTLTGTLPAPTALQVTPTGVNMVVGGTQQFTAVDQLGRPRTDATWTVSNTSVGTIDTSSSPTLTAVGTGTVTLTATVGSETANTVVTVASGTSLSSGTVSWSQAPVTGFTVQQIVQGTSPQNGPSLYSVAIDSSGDALVTALTSDGQQLWTSAPIAAAIVGSYAQSVYAGPDANGGVYLAVFSSASTRKIIDLDGQTGSEVWEYDSSISSPSYAQTVEGFALGGDGTIYFSNQVYVSSGSYHAYTLESVNGATGAHSVLYSVPQATQTFEAGPPPCSSSSTVDPFDGSYLTEPIIGPDGSVYAATSITNATFPSSCSGGAYSYQGGASLIQISPGTLPAVTQFQTYSSSSFSSGGLNVSKVIPDGAGGALVSWGTPTSPSNIMDVASSGNSNTSVSGLSGAATQMVLGDSGAIYATDGTAIASLGSTTWTYNSSPNLHLLASVSGGGVIAKTTTSGSDTVLRFDAAGTPSTDPWSAPGLSYYIGNLWTGFPASGGTAQGYYAAPVLLSGAEWFMADQRGSNASTPIFPVSGFSQMGSNQTAITGMVQEILTNLQNASFTGSTSCENWIQSGPNGSATISTLQGILNSGGGWGHGTISADGQPSPAIGAITYTTTAPPIPATVFTVVNDISGFFNSPPDGWGIPKYHGDGKFARAEILLHELGHLLMLPGFQNDADGIATHANDVLVDNNCHAFIAALP